MTVNTDERRGATETGLDKLAATIGEAEKEGLNVVIRTGGGTGTSPFDLDRRYG